MMPGGTEPESLFAEGADLAEQGRWIDALDRLARAAALKPDCAAYQNNAGVAAWKAGDTQKARQYLEAALRLDPHNGDPRYHLGRVFESTGDWEQALDCYVRAAETLDEAKVHHRTGLMLARAGRFALAARAHKAAVDRDPSHAEAWHALAVNLCSARSLAQADLAWRRAAAVQPGYHAAISHRLLAMHYSSHADPELLYAAHLDWGAEVESQTHCLPAPRTARNAKIRIGYLSPDLDAHSVSYFVEPLLRHHDRSSVETIGFWDRPLSRGRARLESFADRWHDVSSLTNAECADLIHSQQIDVLVDLAGHTSPRNRLIVLAARPARIQVTAIGYPNTTGLTRVDYRLSDSICDPAGRADGFCSEQLLRLDPCFLCYAPPDDSPEILEAGPDRPFTFGCFHALPKISDGVLDVWAEILKGTPGSRLLLKNLEFADPDIRGE